ncbi:hypothetical protein AHAS_Ahas05G0201900 [Arachis hypogaea]
MSRKEEKREKFAHGVCHESLHLGAALGAILHVISTSLLGITAITMANTIAGEETVYKLASMLLVVLGGGYVILFLNGKGGHSHSHNQPMEKMVVAGLILVPAFCLLVLRRFRYFSPRLAVTSTHQLSERSSSTKLFSFLEPNLSHSTLLAGYFSKVYFVVVAYLFSSL